MVLSVKFLGAAGTVTGSKYLVTGHHGQILVDCGMFQGERSWNVKNWEAPHFDPKAIKAVLLTHAHLDHVGMLPRYRQLGLQCPIFCTKATLDLTRVILLDSAKLQEEEAAFRLKEGKSRHNPPLPLYTVKEAEEVIGLLTPVVVHKKTEFLPQMFATWAPMGHIIGACSIRLESPERSILFSGDIGRYSVPILKDPEPCELADLVLIESTYGDRLHGEEDPRDELARIVQQAVQRGGIVMIPSFAVGRTQTILFYLRELKEAKRIPDIPVIIDSPMADDATAIYSANTTDYDEESYRIFRSGGSPFRVPKMGLTRNREESIKLNSIDQPMILISASGMLTGGRILHHLKQRLSNPRNTLLFVGFQPPGSRGDWIKRGAESIRIFGDEVPVRVKVEEISGLSAHGDRDELLRWARSCTGKAGKVAVVHGEPETAKKFAETLRRELQWDSFAAGYLQEVGV